MRLQSPGQERRHHQATAPDGRLADGVRPGRRPITSSTTAKIKPVPAIESRMPTTQASPGTVALADRFADTPEEVEGAVGNYSHRQTDGRPAVENLVDGGLDVELI
jgi:hypothetical protein